MKIALVTGASLSHNPRAVKEADALSAAGHDVVVIGSRADETQWKYDRGLTEKRNWRFVYADYLPSGARSRTNRFVYRLQHKISRLIYRHLGYVTPHLYGYGVSKLRKLARDANADLTIGHNEIGLYVVSRLLESGRTVAFDFEDWHSEDFPPEARHSRPVEALKQLERAILNEASYCTAASEPMAAALHQTYGGKKPKPVHNVFPLDQACQPGNKRTSPAEKALSLVWFSQTLGPGRGLEDVFLALEGLETPVHLHLLGQTSAGAQQWLSSQIPTGWKDYVHVYGLVAPWELVPWVSQFDIGLAVDFPHCRNRDLTITNKIFTYLLAELAVIATGTSGHRQVFSTDPRIGELYSAGDIDSLRKILLSFMKDKQKLLQAQRHAALAASKRYNWDRESDNLLNVVEGVFRTANSNGSR